MLSTKQAVQIAKKNYPSGKIEKIVEYNKVYLLMIFGGDPEEEEMDPFFSVDKETGEFQEFSILTDGDTGEIVSLFVKAESLQQ